MSLLGPDEPHPVSLERAQTRSPFVLTCDHASNRLPAALGTLGLDAAERERHIAWDIGAAGVARHLSRVFDAPLVLQNYSRLVIDCNRPLDSDQLIPLTSEGTAIPGNAALDDTARNARHDAIFAPYHDTITRLLDERHGGGQATALVAVHSFTPTYHGAARPWHIGVLYAEDQRLALPLLDALAAAGDLTVGDNEPYRIDHNDYGIPVHGVARDLPNVLIELRQDLIADERGQLEWALRLAPLLERALDRARGAAG